MFRYELKLSFQREKKSCVRHFKRTCFSLLLYIPRKGQIKNKKKDKYVMPGQIFEAFEGIADDLTMNDDEYLQLIKRSKV